jgi:mannose-6-phosphate isomerase
MVTNFYPIIFTPIYRKNFFGGTKLSSLSGVEDIDTSYEIHDGQSFVSVVENGYLKGKTIKDLIAMDPTGFVGEKQDSTQPFPLSIRIVEARQHLPVRVHPSEAVSKELEGCASKTKMNYLVDTEPDSEVFVGLKSSVSRHNFFEHEVDNVCALLNAYKARRGDVYFIPSGRVYALGAGNVVYEVSQNSSSSFRVLTESEEEAFEGERLSGLKSIHFTDRMTPKIAGDASPITRNKKTSLVQTCPYFTVEELRLNKLFFDATTPESFHTLFSFNESFEIVFGKHKITVPKFRTVFLPAGLGAYRINVSAPTFLLKTKL